MFHYIRNKLSMKKFFSEYEGLAYSKHSDNQGKAAPPPSRMVIVQRIGVLESGECSKLSKESIFPKAIPERTFHEPPTY